ncbi:hypothetical protein V6N12_064147 [Hibiscus sabdariffa]|uniref:Uncharacterized protein n=1 Tax=Hibiscus sabdariffa TaxID=183260 RepID=A0ABR2G4Z1_9ROSI
MGDDMAACNFPNRDEGFLDHKGLIPVVDVDVGIRKKLDLAVGNLKKHGEVIWVPKKLMLSPSKGMDPQDASTSQVAEDVVMDVPLEGQDALGQILEQPSRQPREAAKAVAKIVQGLKAKKKAKVAIRQSKAAIRSLKTYDGVVLHTHDEIAGEVAMFFQDLLGTANADLVGCDKQLLEGILGCTFSSAAKVELSRQVSREEIKVVVF